MKNTMESRPVNNVTPVYMAEPTPYNGRDEVNLVDLALVLLKRKKLIIGIFMFFMIAGLVAALITPKKHTFTSSISIGSQLVTDTIQLFEAPDTVLAKARYSYIPYVIKQHKEASPADNRKYDFNVSVPKGSNIILTKIDGLETEADHYRSLLNTVSQAIIDDHNRIYDGLKQNLSAQIQAKQQELTLFGNQTEDRIEAKNLQIQINSLQGQLANLRPTRQILPPVMSEDPTGTSRKLIVVIALFLGLFASIFAVFFAEFVDKLRQRQQEVDRGTHT